MVKDRARVLNNLTRTQRMLDLMTMQLRSLADERTYAARIGEALKARGGHAEMQRVGVTGGPRLHD